MSRFLSALSWAEGCRAREVCTLSGGQRFGFASTGQQVVIGPGYRPDYIPDPNDPKAQLALALYREALCADSVAYKFLGFYKIINILHDKGGSQKQWIDQALPKPAEHRAIESLREFQHESQQTTTDVADYLYVSGRCAVAHAFSTPIVDPDSFDDEWRLKADLPIIRALAEYLIEIELGVKSRATVEKERREA